MTHLGDPCPNGIWGHSGKKGCMGRVRDYPYEAVIGIGGSTAKDNIAGRLVWIGINPTREYKHDRTLVKFELFAHCSNNKWSPIDKKWQFYKYMFGGKRRLQLSQNLKGDTKIISKINEEISEILELAKKARKSNKFNSLNRSTKKCKRKKSTSSC